MKKRRRQGKKIAEKEGAREKSLLRKKALAEKRFRNQEAEESKMKSGNKQIKK